MKNFFLTHKNPIIIILTIIMFGGIIAYENLKTSLFPEITFPKIKIIADAGLQPVERMMVTVTRPLENAVKQVPGLKLVRSTTSRGSCEISAFMNWNTDIDLSQQRIESRINQIRNALPPDINISVEKMNPSILPVMGYTLESHSKSPIELRQIATYTIKPFLSQVEGVAEVRVSGGKAKEYWVELDKNKMSSLNLTPQQVNTALSQTNFIRSNGYLSDYKLLYLTITDAAVTTKSDLEDVVVSNNAHRVIQIKDIARVNIEEGVEYTKINANGHDAVLIAVIKQPEANLITLTQEMEKKIKLLQDILPAGVSVKPYYIQADFVNDSVKSVTDSLWIGLGLAIIVAIIFLRSLRASSTILITIPLTLCLTVMVLYSIGYTLNIMTLGAIAAAIGLIIDDAIVVVEQIHRTHEEYPDLESDDLVHKAIRYLFQAMLGSSLSTIVIFIPFLLMTGVAGAYFKVMTNTMIIALVCSFFVTWICLPVVYLLLGKRVKPPKKKQIEVHTVKNQAWVRWFIRKPMFSFAAIMVFILVIILVLPKLQTGFLPEMDEGSIVLDYKSPPGTSLQETDRMLKEVEQIIIKIPDIETYSRRTGTQMGFFITEPNNGDYLIQLKKQRSRTTEEVISEIRNKITATQPSLEIDFGQVIGDMLGDLMNSTQPVEIKIFGDNHLKLNALSTAVAAIVSKVRGAADVFDGVIIAGPSINVRPIYSQLAQYGISVTDFQYQLQMALEGNPAGTVLEKEQLSTIRLVYPNSRKYNAAGIKSMQLFLPNGKLVPITNLAVIDINAGDAEIARENLQAMGVVTARLENRDLGTTIQDIKQQVSSSIHLPPGYHIEYGGAYAEQQQSFKELLMILVSSSLLVFAVILFLFKDFKIATLILFIAVLGISGSYLALFLTHTALNVGSYTGLIMIIGIIGENAIFTFLQFKESCKENNVQEAIVYAISTRLRPKLMTALGAIIALMPLALGIGAGAQLHQPLAIAVIGGFIVAMPLLLIVLPSMINLLYKDH
nr:efflux RND transporter permease subunit [uncultured Pedobacter sp.]